MNKYIFLAVFAFTMAFPVYADDRTSILNAIIKLQNEIAVLQAQLNSLKSMDETKDETKNETGINKTNLNLLKSETKPILKVPPKGKVRSLKELLQSQSKSRQNQ